MADRPAHPTQTDVAERAGISRALVSIVFRDQPGASEATRKHVRAVAAEIGYIPDQRAQLLRRKSATVIGVAYGLAHDFHGTLVEHLYSAAEDLGLTLILSGYGSTRTEDTATSSLIAYRCGGLVLVGSTCSARWMADIARTVPVVSALRFAKPPVAVVRTDDVAGAREATTHLINLGHRRLVHVDGGRAPGSADRRRSFRRTVERLGGEGTIIPGGPTEADGLRAGERLVGLLGRSDSPTGVVAFNDRSAVGILATIRRARYDVPNDVSVVGFDDNPIAAAAGIDLTTVRQDSRALAEQSLRLLVQRMTDPGLAPQEAMLAPQLVIRRTSAAPR